MEMLRSLEQTLKPQTLEEQGFGWKNPEGKGNAENTVTSGIGRSLDNLLLNKWNQHIFSFATKL
jgi:catalase (peroxidase I)